MNNWKEERQKVFRRAEAWQREVQNTKVALGATFWGQAQEWCNEDPEGRAVLREFAALIYDHLMEAAKYLEVQLVHGVVSFIQHAWFVVEGDLGVLDLALPGFRAPEHLLPFFFPVVHFDISCLRLRSSLVVTNFVSRSVL